MREADMADLKREIDTATHGVTAPFDPLESKEATKWEPKSGEASKSTVQPVEAPSPQAAMAHDEIRPQPKRRREPSESAPQGGIRQVGTARSTSGRRLRRRPFTNPQTRHRPRRAKPPHRR